MRADPHLSWYEARIDQLPLRIAYDGANVPMLAPPGHTGLTTIACGFLSCDIRPFNPLIAALPRLLHLHAADPADAFAQLIQRAVAESHAHRPGGEPAVKDGRVRLLAPLAETLRAAANPESYVRIVVTRGAGPIGLDPALGDQPRLVVIVTDLAPPEERLYREGAAVAIVNLQRTLDPSIKSGNIIVQAYAAELGAELFPRYRSVPPVAITVRGHSALTPMPSPRNSSAMPNTHRLIPYFAIV